jgi:predicted NAD-dependent protein-ADP-ribosyltransferase YbiA (DUF1768 family)
MERSIPPQSTVCLPLAYFEAHAESQDGLVFQASKFIEHHPHIAEEIRHLPTSREALQAATRLQHLRRRDWFDVNVIVMDMVLEAKFTQHAQLYELLLGTGDRELIEASPVRQRKTTSPSSSKKNSHLAKQIDSFWGWGENRQGRNELGKALMRLRDKLRQSPSSDRVQSGSFL